MLKDVMVRSPLNAESGYARRRRARRILKLYLEYIETQGAARGRPRRSTDGARRLQVRLDVGAERSAVGQGLGAAQDDELEGGGHGGLLFRHGMWPGQ